MKPEELRLVRWPDPILTQVAAPIEGDLESWRPVAKRMFEIMYAHGGCGLAGPQAGVPHRIFVVNVNGKEAVFLNPVLLDACENKGTHAGLEGCLSLPGLSVTVTRPRQIMVEWMDLDGKKQKAQYAGLMGRCWQHENDHLNGRLITDHLPADKREEVLARLQRNLSGVR